MTLVQNLQQQLSGNKGKLLVLVMLVFTLQSCSVFEGIFGKKRTPPPPDPQVHYPDDDPVKPTEDTDVVVVVEPDNDVDTIKKDKPVEVFDEVNIGIMLPFGLDNLDAGKGYKTSNRYGFELYKGIQMALEDLDVERLKLKIHVLDNAGTVIPIHTFIRQ